MILVDTNVVSEPLRKSPEPRWVEPGKTVRGALEHLGEATVSFAP